MVCEPVEGAVFIAMPGQNAFVKGQTLDKPEIFSPA